MPYVSITTNKPAPSEVQEKLKQEIGKKIELIPRKTEKWLMCQINEDANLYFGGTKDDAVYIEVKIFGSIDKETAEQFTAETTKTVSDILGVRPDRIYVSFFPTSIWGYNGHNF